MENAPAHYLNFCLMTCHGKNAISRMLLYKPSNLYSRLQLYEIDDNPKRREFLDEIFSFMQKRGKKRSFIILV